MKPSKVIIFILVISAFGAGIYFKNDVLRFYNNLTKQVQNFQKTDIGQRLTQAGKQILSPPPLTIGGFGNATVLLQSKIISETNLQRQENGNLPALKENQTLDKIASEKANDMFLNQYFEHVSLAGVGPGELAQKYGYNYIVEGENLILGNFSSEKEVLQDWMNSPGHRANILNTRYAEIGVSVIKGKYKGETVWIGVQEFGLPLSSCAEPSNDLKNQIDSDKVQLDAMFLQIGKDQQQIKNADQSSAAYRQMVDDYNKLVTQYDSLADEVKKIIADYNAQVGTFNSCVAGK